MSLVSWYYSADGLETVVNWISAIGILVELAVALVALIDWRSNKDGKEKEYNLDGYIALMALIAATCGCVVFFLSLRANRLEAKEHKLEREQYESALLKQSTELATTESNLQITIGHVRSLASNRENEMVWRTISDRDGAIGRLRAFSRTHVFIVSENDAETQSLANQISFVVSNAEWLVRPSLPPGRSWDVGIPSKVYGVWSWTNGVSVETSSDDERSALPLAIRIDTAADALVKELLANGIVARRKRSSMMPRDIVLVRVWLRPGLRR